MIHVVIVEDELLVRLGTKLCLDGYESRITVDAVFDTGEDAEDYFGSHTADVLVTDIRLPKMSGLELIRRIREEHMHMGLLVLSCYEDFSYAREAMELGVDKYLLKHELTGDDLPRAVLEVYENGKGFSARQEIKTHFPERDEGVAAYAGYRIGYLILRGEEDDKNADSRQVDFEVLSGIVQKLLNVGKLGECFLRHGEEVFLVFHREERISEEEFRGKLRLFFQQLERNLQNYFNKNTYLTLSEEFQSMKQIKEFFSETQSWSYVSFYYEESKLFETDLLKRRCLAVPELKIVQNDLFTEKWFEENKRKIRDFFFQARKNISDVTMLKGKVVKYFYGLEALYPDAEGGKLFRDYKELDAFDSSSCMEGWLLGLLEQMEGKLARQKNQIESIEQFVMQHYAEDMSLERMSSQFHMSMTYFCQYFKKKKGISFVPYVNSIRMERAKELLKDPEVSAEEAAEAVGIANTNYFIRLFKKTTGKTVGEYRKNIK